jgi:hypothetical protein
MARDLIPPPSPAGRPDPDGTLTHRFVELPPEPQAPPEPPAPVALGPTEYRTRFGFIAGALAGVLLGAVAVVIAVFAYSDGAEDHGMYANWSRWRPADESLQDGAAQIAEHVGAEYKHPDGNQLLEVQPVFTGELPLKIAASSITDMTGDTVVYRLAGLGEGGAIEGEGSDERGAVVFREALELSLYTFRYLPDAEGVLVMLPPPPADPKTQAANQEMAKAAAAGDAEAAAKLAALEQEQQRAAHRAVFFRAGDLKSELQVPLGATVPAGAPNAETITDAEVREFQQRVRSNLFTYDEQPGTGVVLRPLRTTP